MLLQFKPLVRKQFGFLFKPIGRGLYLFMIGVFPIGLGDFGTAAASLMFLNAFLNAYIWCKWPVNRVQEKQEREQYIQHQQELHATGIGIGSGGAPPGAAGAGAGVFSGRGNI